ncbi:MAG: T9SS type A sorting domain-containing protein, partial [Flavobacteriales bacterium]|nr:T9SS type A sorting domain-containing protein [Flavobacteriales bacterium]
SILEKTLLIVAILTSLQGFTQISHGGSPLSFSENLTIAPTYVTPILNIEPFIEEDIVTDQYKDIAWRFGIEQFVNLNLSNSGVWETLSNGDRIWRLEIQSPNAKTINLNYSSFHLPTGATFFVYNNNQVLGSFTHENNKTTGQFSTSILKGDNVILEYVEPVAVQGQGIIEVSSVVHGYRDLFSQIEGFGSSGACNINAICDTSFWGNEIRSAVMLLTAGNSRFCSGALVNNTLQNGTPYVLTADHCGPLTNNIFMFNYQSATCSPSVDGVTTQTISGCITRANDGPSDFFLVELSSTPPSNYNVFYSGWSSVNISPTKGTGIHFPALDVKKISHDNDLIVESGYYTSGNNHWEVLDWNSGTTEGGSSGSPLFDQNHRIVGQLHGGDAACGNDAFDFYGKFSYSWETNALTSKQLKFWLDPNGSGVPVLDGYDPNGATNNTDAVLLDISGIDAFICGDSITPKITIRNHGSSNLVSLNINYELDGGGVNTVNWSGNLPSYAIDSINLPTIYIPGGSHIFTANCTNPNGTSDQNLSNDSASIGFNSHDNPVLATLNLTTDNYGTETSWAVRNLAGNIVIQGGGYQNVTGGELITESLCLIDSCFTFILYDSFGDGFCCAFGNGEFQLLNALGDTLAENYTFNGDSLTFPFCLVASTNSYSTINNAFNIYPNPTEGIFTIATKNNNPFDIAIYDVLGKIIYQKQKESNKEIQVDLSSARKGIYFVSIISENERIVKRLVIN